MGNLDPAGVLVFFAALSGVAALATNRPEQRGIQRVWMAACACVSAGAGNVLAPSRLWFAVLLVGFYQGYLGWGFIRRRRQITPPREEYLRSSATVLACIALADSSIEHRELNIIREWYQRAGGSPEEFTVVEGTLRGCAQRLLGSTSDPNRVTEELRAACTSLVRHASDDTRRELLRVALLIAAGDGDFGASERHAVTTAAAALQIDERQLAEIWSAVFSTDPGISRK